MGHQAKWEYFRAVYERYRKAGREAKRVMLNEFCLNTGYHVSILGRANPARSAPARANDLAWIIQCAVKGVGPQRVKFPPGSSRSN